MPYDTDTADRSWWGPALDPSELDRTDRILLGACAAIWLVALGVAVAATVALVDLGTGQSEPSGEQGSPWLLYTVIGVSALVIIGAVPLLVRARRAGLADAQSPPRAAVRPSPGRPQPQVAGVEAPTEKLRISGTTSAGPRPAEPAQRISMTAPTSTMTAVDQLWLRCAVVIACAIGIAMVAIGVGTYLMAVDSNAAAWVLYGLAGLITLAMPAVPWFYLRELRTLVDKS